MTVNARFASVPFVLSSVCTYAVLVLLEDTQVIPPVPPPHRPTRMFPEVRPCPDRHSMVAETARPATGAPKLTKYSPVKEWLTVIPPDCASIVPSPSISAQRIAPWYADGGDPPKAFALLAVVAEVALSALVA